MKLLIKIIVDQSLYNEDEVLYISKSRKLIRYLKDLDLDVLYDPILNAGKESKLESISTEQSERLAKAKNAMIAYFIQEDKANDPKMRDMVLEAGVQDFKLNARDLVIYPFLGNYRGLHKNSFGTAPKTVEDELDPENIDEDIRIFNIPINKI